MMDMYDLPGEHAPENTIHPTSLADELQDENLGDTEYDDYMLLPSQSEDNCEYMMKTYLSDVLSARLMY